MADSDLQAEIQQLRTLVNQLAARLGQLEKPQGRIFPADLANPGSTNRAMEELIPNAAGTALANLTDGRTVSGTTDPGVFLAIPRLESNQGMLMGFNNGTNAVYIRISDQLRFGKITAVGDCNSYATVKQCKLDGTLLGDKLIAVAPTLGGCDATANGFCYSVGEVIAYMEMPDDPGQGVQVGAYKTIVGSYICTTTSTTHVPDLSTLRFYNGDFTLMAHSTCGDDGTVNELDVYWDGNFVTDVYAGTTYDHVKVFKLDGSSPTAMGTNFSDLAFLITSGTTNANVPTVGGSPCADQSGPNFVKVTVRAKKGTVNSATGVTCNEDGTITLNYDAVEVLMPIT